MTVAEVTTLSPERAALRARHVGASEVAALFSLHPYLSRFRLWNLKAGRIAEDNLAGNKRVAAGIFMEPAIAAWVKHETGWPLEKVDRYCEHPTVKGMGASPDYEYRAADGALVTVQIKNVDAIVFSRWENGEPPMVYQLQVQHEIACGGYSRGVLAVCVGGNDLRTFEFSPHPEAIAKIELAVAEFWRSIEADECPEPDFSQDLETIEQIYSLTELGDVRDMTLGSADSEEGERVALAVAKACARYDEAGSREKAAKADKDAAKAEILTLIDSAAAAVTDGFKVTTWNVDEAEVAYVRKPFRNMRVTNLSAAKAKKGR